MGSLFAFFTLFSLVLFASTIVDARPDTGEYWQGIMKDQPMPEAIQGLIHEGGSVTPLSHKKTDCHTSTEEKSFVKDFNPRPSATAYSEDVGLQGEKSFVKDFNPRPGATAYSEDVGLQGEKSFVKDFEPRPNLSAYDDDAGLKEENKSFAKDFEPRPNLSAYDDMMLV